MKSKKKIENSFEDSEYLSTSLSSGSDENQQSADTTLNTSSFNVPNLLNINHLPLSTPDSESPTDNYESHNILARAPVVHKNIKNKLSLFQKFPLNNVSSKAKINSDSTVFGFKSMDDGHAASNLESNKLTDQNDEPQMKLIKKDSPIILGDLVTENSCNAVDNELNKKLDNTLAISESNSDLSFNGRIDSLNSNTNFNLNVNTTEISPEILLQTVASPNCTKTRKLLTHDTSNLMYTNEKSPDLFDDEDDEVIVNRANSYSNGTDTTVTAGTINCDDIDVGCSINDKSGCESLSQSYDENKNKTDPSPHVKHEEILLKRLQMSLTGVLPPPSITISQINITKMIQLYKENSEKYIISSITKREDQVSTSKDLDTDTRSPSLLIPTHTIEETIKAEWPQMKEIKNHGIHYNRSKFSERFENLSLRYVERYVGAETSSSFSMPASPTSAKKRNMRIKLLGKSPGNRLSHLARRRAIFSSEHLAGQSSKSSLHSHLDAKRQILLDPKRSQRNARKILTPKRRTPGRRTPSRRTPSRRTPSRRTPGRRKTPLSKNKNKLSKNLFGATSSVNKNNRPTTNTSDPVLRETSKRALFQSPPKSKPIMTQITPEIVNRAQKSKRVLFTPEKLSRSTSMNAVNSLQSENNEKIGKLRYNSLMCLNELNENTTPKLISLKRKRSDYEMENNENKLTPNSLKFVKSQSFCANTENNNPDNMKMISSESGRNLFYRSTSEIIPSSATGSQSTSSQLSEHHRKKLFWAVSHALQMKQINVKHPNFKQYASVLARATKRLYLEYEEHKSGSTSEKMMKLTSRLVFNVIQGKSVDDVYEIESKNLENAKNKLERSQASFQFLENKTLIEGEQ